MAQNSRWTTKIGRTAWVILFAVVGILTLLVTRAATPSASFEAEDGAISGTVQKKFSDVTASGSANGYVQFGATGGGVSQPSLWVDITKNIPLTAGGSNNYGLLSVATAPSNTSVVYTGGCGTGIWKSTDQGNSWGYTATGNSDATFKDGCIEMIGVDPTNQDVLYVNSLFVGYSVFKSTDGGKTWTDKLKNSPVLNIFGTNDPYNISFDPLDHNHIIVGGHQDWGGYSSTGILESKNGGDTWTTINPSLGWAKGANAKFIDSSTWLMGTEGGYFRSTDSGRNWTQVPTQGLVQTHGELGLYKASTGSLYMTAKDAIMRSTDNGANWTRVGASTLPGTQGYNAIIGDGTYMYVNPNPIYPVAAMPWYYSPETDGNTWQVLNPTQTFTTGPSSMAIDPGNRIIYATMVNNGIWKLSY